MDSVEARVFTSVLLLEKDFYGLIDVGGFIERQFLWCEDHVGLACDLEFCIERRVGTLRTCFGSDLNTVWLPR